MLRPPAVPVSTVRGITTGYPPSAKCEDTQSDQGDLDSDQAEAVAHRELCQVPTLSPHYAHPTGASATEFLYLIKYLEESRQFDATHRWEKEDARRLEKDNRRHEEVRCRVEEAWMIEDEAGQKEDKERFMTLIQLLSTPMKTMTA
ncbi:hypothetical protein SK128_014289 [Halocaridina rubra]|uniref:Uncharacterized protein n=1 Tax=Halocaridina rubra TaxID=373956 RepID=A0AAN8XWA5_HALRR